MFVFEKPDHHNPKKNTRENQRLSSRREKCNTGQTLFFYFVIQQFLPENYFLFETILWMTYLTISSVQRCITLKFKLFVIINTKRINKKPFLVLKIKPYVFIRKLKMYQSFSLLVLQQNYILKSTTIFLKLV